MSSFNGGKRFPGYVCILSRIVSTASSKALASTLPNGDEGRQEGAHEGE